MSSTRLMALLTCCVAGAAWADPDPVALLKAADAIMAPDQYEADTRLIHHRGKEETREFAMHLWKKGDHRFRVAFTAPPEDRGSEVLRDGDNMWNYLPNLKRSLKISPKQEFHGGDFNNTDILRVNLANDYLPTLVPSTDPNEWLLELRAKDDTVSYDLIKYWLRKKDNLPLREEFYTKSGKLIRKMTISEPKKFGKLIRPTHLVMQNILMPDRQTEMIFDKFSVKDNISDDVFQSTVLGR